MSPALIASPNMSVLEATTILLDDVSVFRLPMTLRTSNTATSPEIIAAIIIAIVIGLITNSGFTVTHI